ncbi:Sporulation kinase E [Pelotomaculum sp. FP]|uniref:PAS domain-containing protein n=1 Tax=Pelotomaculum sp. FP TaxID=261474 RepID=UPI001065D57C|nr:PAS domain-containing sensor histidine kinase [Pelotomaculum sp. FP]TEB15202.1 Sporulation kinase E [Pelotomaculum sp. FP]
MKDKDKTKEQLIDELAGLREQVNFYKQVLDELPVSTVFYDKSEKLIYKNKATQLIDGYEDKLFPSLNKCVLGPKEIAIVAKDGAAKEVLLIENPIYDYNSNFMGTCVCALDITNYVMEIKQAGEALQEQLHFMQRLIDTIPNPIFYKDVKGFYNGCNKAWEQYLGLTKEEIVGASAYDIHPKDLADKYHEMDELLFNNPGVQLYEIPFIHADGTKHEVILNKATYLNNNGSLAGLVGVLIDITERKLVEEKLRSANQRFQDIIEFLPDATYVVDSEKKVIAWNLAMEEHTGIPKRDILGKEGNIDTIPYYGKARLNLIDLLLAEDKGMEKYYDYVERKGNTISAEVYLPFVNKGMGAYLWGIASLLFDGNGNMIGAIQSNRDITSRKLYEKSLKLSEERFAKAFNASPELMAITTIADGRYIDVNKSFLRTTGYHRDEVIGHTSNEINIWVDPETRKVLIDTIEKHGSIYNKELSIRAKSGEEREVLFSAEIISLNDEQCMLTVVNDITNRKKIEKEMARLDRLNMVGEMAAGIGHEIRNPLTIVKGFLQLLRSKEQCSQYLEFFDLMIDELERANSIITEFLSLAKNRVVNLKKVNINSILETMLPLIQADGFKSDKHIIMELGDIPELLLDEKEMRQLILNLVRNGLEAMNNSGNLTIRTYTDSEEVVLAVQDEGAGIPEEILGKIGTPFFTTKESGTGLGLAVCYSIIAKHKANVKISTGSTGTTFYVRFAR